MGCGFCKYDITTADIDNIKLLSICLVSSLTLELAKLIHEQYSETHAHHFNLIIKPHMLKVIPNIFI